MFPFDQAQKRRFSVFLMWFEVNSLLFFYATAPYFLVLSSRKDILKGDNLHEVKESLIAAAEILLRSIGCPSFSTNFIWHRGTTSQRAGFRLVSQPTRCSTAASNSVKSHWGTHGSLFA